MEQSHRELVFRYTNELNDLDHWQPEDITGRRLTLLEKYVEDLHNEMDVLMAVLDQAIGDPCKIGFTLSRTNPCKQLLKAKQIRLELARVYKQQLVDIDLTEDSDKQKKVQLLEKYVDDLNEHMEALLPMVKEHAAKIKNLHFPLAVDKRPPDSLSQFRWLVEDVERERGSEFAETRRGSNTECETLAKKYETINRLQFQIEQLVQHKERSFKEMNDLRRHNEDLKQSVTHSEEELGQLKVVIQRQKEVEHESNEQLQSLKGIVAEQRSNLNARKSNMVEAVEEVISLRKKMDKLMAAEEASVDMRLKSQNVQMADAHEVGNLHGQLPESVNMSRNHAQDLIETTEYSDNELNHISTLLEHFNETSRHIDTSVKNLKMLMTTLKIVLDKYNDISIKETTLDIFTELDQALQFTSDLKDLGRNVGSTHSDLRSIVSNMHEELGRYKDVTTKQEGALSKMGEELRQVRAKLSEAEIKKKHYKKEVHIVATECHDMYLQLQQARKKQNNKTTLTSL